MAEECLAEYNERSSVIVTAAFTDEDDAPVTPDSATYRVDDEASRSAIVLSTPISPLSTSASIKVGSEANAIIRPRNRFEIRTVTVEFDYTSATYGAMHGTSVYRYKLWNLYGVVDVASASQSPSASASPS